ncbi:hypothetical protein MKX29_24390 [Cytobacillus sp. FSL R7-0696]|uniref:hypothetical protein n=1 Tax=Cytobacillus sp. FSL R7-0696 TaxID=2921691 RepID=UPI0030F65136
MAKFLLWIVVVLGLISSITLYQNGEGVSLFTRILIWSSVGVLALCESIEKLKDETK